MNYISVYNNNNSTITTLPAFNGERGDYYVNSNGDVIMNNAYYNNSSRGNYVINSNGDFIMNNAYGGKRKRKRKSQKESRRQRKKSCKR